MCGICGKLVFNASEGVETGLINSMLATIRYRGPDDEGVYSEPGCSSGPSCRLSIIDLNTGHQPLSNEDGSIWIVFNGEIYNYRELRTFLLSRGHSLKTQTDTEVIVHLYEEFGARLFNEAAGHVFLRYLGSEGEDDVTGARSLRHQAVVLLHNR